MSGREAITRLISFMRLKHWSLRTENSYVRWAQKYTLFLQQNRPSGSSEEKVRAYLSSIAPVCSAKTQEQCLNALVVFYREGIGEPLGELGDWSRAKRPKRMPSWLDRDDAVRLIQLIPGTQGLMARLLFGSGLRLMECVRLRVKDVDLKHRTLFIRGAKGEKDRVVGMPESVVGPLGEHLVRVKALWEGDRANDLPTIHLPTPGLEAKYPNAGKEWPWFWVFPSRTLSRDPRTGIMRRHHIHENSIQKAIKAAAKLAGLDKRVSPHVLRHSYATALVRNGTDISKIQALLGHSDIRTTSVYLHALPSALTGVKSPLD